MVDPLGLWAEGHYGFAKKGEFKGHSDFYGFEFFDYNLEDRDPATTPMDPVNGAPANHFQDLWQSAQQVRRAIDECDKEEFGRALHRLQDFWSHYNKGYRWNPAKGQYGHAIDSVRGRSPDEDNVEWLRAENTTRLYVQKWIKKWGQPSRRPMGPGKM